MQRSPFYTICFLFLFAPHVARAQSADTPVECMDNFFERISSGEGLLVRMHPMATVVSVVYDSSRSAQAHRMDLEEYSVFVDELHDQYHVTLVPVVMNLRTYGRTSTAIASVWMRFVHKETNDTIYSRSLQSIKMLERNGRWMVQHLSVQNEHPLYPIPEEYWPAEITQNMPLLARGSTSVRDPEAYDERVVYLPNQVDELPVYPLEPSVFETFMKSFDVVAMPAPGYTAFRVVIAEDGGASLPEDQPLSSFQQGRASTFVRSMMVWYPAVKDAASVKCELQFYIRE